VVNDCSEDNASGISTACGALVKDLPINMGAGYATRLGCDLAIPMGAEIIVTIDADEQQNPEDIPKLLSALVDNKLISFSDTGPRNQNMPVINKIGGTILYRLSQLFFHVDIEDTQTVSTHLQKNAVQNYDGIQMDMVLLPSLSCKYQSKS